MYKYVNINYKELALKATLFIINLLFLVILILLNVDVIYAQADYMGPGVPYSSQCYQKNSDNSTLTLKYKLNFPETEMYVNKNNIADLFVISNKNFTPQKLQLSVTYNANLINIKKITTTLCNQSTDTIKIDNTNGVLNLSLNTNSCPKIKLQKGDNLIAKVEFIPIKEGTALIKLHEMNDNPQSYALANNTSINILPLQDIYEIPIISTNTNPTNPYQNPTPNPTIVPPNGIFDETNTILAIILIGVAIIIYTSITGKRNIKSKYVSYEEN